MANGKLRINSLFSKEEKKRKRIIVMNKNKKKNRNLNTILNKSIYFIKIFKLYAM